MSSEETAALQADEVEVLKSIYEGDAAFTALSDTQYQYKYGDDTSARSFVLDISWPDAYPEVKPDISMDAFYNKHVVDEVKCRVKEKVEAEAEMYLGMSMTFTLFEFVKEALEELLEGQPEQLVTEVANNIEDLSLKESESSKPKVKKEQLTKAQKRRMWDKGGEKDERPRGWDWIDVIRHLSQTGSKEDS